MIDLTIIVVLCAFWFWIASRSAKPELEQRFDAQSSDGIETFNRERGWQQTNSGGKFYPLNPKADDIRLQDVAAGLAKTCRYSGQCKRFYSVAEHCVIVSKLVPPEYALEALLHDSAEAYIGDMIRPLKHQPEMAEFRKAEAAIEVAVFAHFAINSTPESHAAVKQVDNRLLVDEISQLMPRPKMYDDVNTLQPMGVTVEGWMPDEAERLYIQRFYEIKVMGG